MDPVKIHRNLSTDFQTSCSMKKALGDTQTLRAACMAEPKKFRRAADPFPGGVGRPKFYQLEMVTLPSPTDPVW